MAAPVAAEDRPETGAALNAHQRRTLRRGINRAIRKASQRSKTWLEERTRTQRNRFMLGDCTLTMTVDGVTYTLQGIIDYSPIERN